MKRARPDEKENHERWLVSYADFMTLLFAFFVVMYAVSRVDKQRLVVAQSSIKWALHFSGTGGIGELPLFEGPPSEGGCVTNMGNSARATLDEVKAVEALRQKLDKRLHPYLQERADGAPAVVIQAEGRRLIVRLSATRFFDASQAALRPDAFPILDAIVRELTRLKRHIRVEGHTDDRPVPPGRFRDNWELSSSRAAAVVSYLEQVHRLPAATLSTAGHAATRPLVPNVTPEGRQANRRIELSVEVQPGDDFDP